MSATASSARPPAGASHLGRGLLVSLALIGGIAFQLGVTGSDRALDRTLWLDEFVSYSQLLVTGSWRERLGVMARSPDVTPPGYYLLLEAWLALVGGNRSALWLRLFSLAWVLVGLAAMHLLLRRWVSPVAAAAGVLAIWANPLALQYAFELRAYAPWFGLLACFCLLLGRVNDPRWRRGARPLLGLCSVLLCTVHWFAPITACMALGGWALVEARGCRRALRGAWPAAFGFASFAACLPIFLQQVVAIRSPAWWIAKRTPVQELVFGVTFASSAVLTAAAALALATELGVGRRRGPRGEGNPAASGPAAAFALALLPWVFVLASLLYKPMSIGRYIAPATLANGPLVGFLVERTARPLAWMTLVFAALVSTLGLSQQGDQAAKLDRGHRLTLALVQRHAGEGLVVFEDALQIPPLLWLDPGLGSRIAYLDLGERSDQFSAFMRVYLAANEQSWGWPRRVRDVDLDALGRFFVVAERSPARWRSIDERFTVAPVAAPLWVLEPRSNAKERRGGVRSE